MKIRKNHLWICLPALLLAAGSALAGVQHVTECGTVLAEPGNYHLKKDLLDCPEFGVVIGGSNITLDLKGHMVACLESDAPTIGVGLIGSSEDAVRNITVKNGYVANCHDGILLSNAEDSKIMKMTSSGNRLWRGRFGTGITVWKSHNNLIMKNHLFGNASTGIGSWQSSRNIFKHNTSNGNGNGLWVGTGIDVGTTTDSLFMCNRLYGNVDGIILAEGSTGNHIKGNDASGNILSGIDMLGYVEEGELLEFIPGGNTVEKNIAENNGWLDLSEIYYDLVTDEVFADPDGTCMNTWRKNRFGEVLGAPGCFGVSFDLKDVCASDD